jgi:hypothetical protein
MPIDNFADGIATQPGAASTLRHGSIANDYELGTRR